MARKQKKSKKAKVQKVQNKTALSQAMAKTADSRVTQARSFFSQKENVKKALIVLIVIFALYLLKDQLIVATVNGEPIFRWTVIQKLEEQGGRQVVDTLITEKLVRQAIRDANIQVDEDEISATIAEIEARLASQGMTLDQALAQEGLTRQKLEDDIRLQKSAEKLVADKVSITDEEVDTYIADNKDFLPADLTGEALRSEVRTQLMADKTNTAIQTWVQELTANANVQYWKEYKIGF